MGQEGTPESTAAPIGLKGIAYGGKGYVAVGDRGTILSSADGIAWKRSASGLRRPVCRDLVLRALRWRPVPSTPR